MPTYRTALSWLQDPSGGRMPAHARPLAISLLLAALVMACGRDKTTLLDPPSLASNKPHTISGNVLGPDGRNICRSIGAGTMVVQLLNPDFGVSPDPFLGQQNITCPRNAYSLPMNAGTAHLRVTLPITEGLNGLPWRHLEEVEVGDEGTEHDVTIVAGTGLGGSATLDGERFAGVFLQLLYDFNANFGVTNGLSDTLGPGGSWTEFFGRTPMILQNGVRYTTASTCGGMLGTRLVSGFSDGSFVFPAEVDALNCTLETGAATRFSHTFTRLVVTPMPGDIGGSLSADFFDQYGVGWGVQFPVDLAASPSHDPGFSEIFNGGLLIGIGNDQVLAGADAASMMECGATCRDLGLNGTVKFTTQRDGSKSVTWRYSDATSAEAVGLEVTQLSTDGKLPDDYVVFQFSIRNTRTSTVTFHAGFFGDWDVQLDAFDDLGATDLGGKLMYQVSANESGIHAGTMLLGAPVTGNFFFDGLEGAFPSTADQVQALSGGLRRETAGPGDLRYIQGAGPITLKKGQRKDIWIAVVAGETKGQLLANAAAAEAEVARSLNQPLDADAATSPVTTNPSPQAASRGLSRPICKNCQPQ
jgi:hypothetical protein